MTDELDPGFEQEVLSHFYTALLKKAKPSSEAKVTSVKLGEDSDFNIELGFEDKTSIFLSKLWVAEILPEFIKEYTYE